MNQQRAEATFRPLSFWLFREKVRSFPTLLDQHLLEYGVLVDGGKEEHAGAQLDGVGAEELVGRTFAGIHGLSDFDEALPQERERQRGAGFRPRAFLSALFSMSVLVYHFPERFGQGHVLHILATLEVGRHIRGAQSGDAATNRRDEEGRIGMLLRIRHKRLHVAGHDIRSAHRVDRITFALRTVSVAHHSPEMVHCITSGTAQMTARTVGAKHEDLLRPQPRDVLGRDAVGRDVGALRHGRFRILHLFNHFCLTCVSFGSVNIAIAIG